MKRRRFKPIGRPVQLGAVEEYGPARAVTLVVGQHRGLKPANQSGRCARKPSKFSAPAVDNTFIRLRAAQVGRENVGATRHTGRGWYEGKPEASVAYEVAFIPSSREGSYEQFTKNMNRLAERMAQAFCQDSVLVLREKKTAAASASWAGARRRR